MCAGESCPHGWPSPSQLRAARFGSLRRWPQEAPGASQIGRASCREREQISVVAASLKKKLTRRFPLARVARTACLQPRSFAPRGLGAFGDGRKKRPERRQASWSAALPRSLRRSEQTKKQCNWTADVRWRELPARLAFTLAVARREVWEPSAMAARSARSV